MMPKPQTVKCMFCKESIDKSNAYLVGTKSYYCSEAHYHLKQNKDKFKPKDESERRKLTDYIVTVYLEYGYDKSAINWTLLMKQVKNMMEEHKELDMKYTGIKYCLWYLKEVEEINLLNNESGSILGLVPFKYIDAKMFYNKQKEIKKKIQEFDFMNETVVIKKPIKEKSIYIDDFEEMD